MDRNEKKLQPSVQTEEKMKKVAGGFGMYMMVCSECHYSTFWGWPAQNVECPQCHNPTSFSQL